MSDPPNTLPEVLEAQSEALGDKPFLYFEDRKTDSLRRRGENISSWEVEREIEARPAALESAVLGVPSELGEHDLMAVVVLKEGRSLTPDELLRHCEKRMAKFMVPRYVEFRGKLPKTGAHRVQKGVLERAGVGPNTWDREAQPPQEIAKRPTKGAENGEYRSRVGAVRRGAADSGDSSQVRSRGHAAGGHRARQAG